MTDTGPASVPTNNESQHRFELVRDGHLGVLRYRISGNKMTLIHTEVPPELEGKGVGSTLVKAALDFARERHMIVEAICPFVRIYLRRHPEHHA